MSQRILIMGLPGSGKTFLAKELQKRFEALGKTVQWLNADVVRERFKDWDFSEEGRIRQSIRMKALADETDADITIADFVAPLEQMRVNYNADWTIWVDTIEQGRYEDTNKAFVKPEMYDIRVTEQDCKKWAGIIIEKMGIRRKETHLRSLAKAISWRITGTADTFLVSWFITGQVALASGIALTEVFTKVGLYYLHERAWSKINV